MFKVAHITSAHPRDDSRIFTKMCLSLAKDNYDVSLIVADGKGDEKIEKISIFDVGSASSRFKRIIFSSWKVYKKSLSIDADLYHIHDPELLLFALSLKSRGKRVIFDSHEDIPISILSKSYLPKILLRILGNAFIYFEQFLYPRVDAVIGATPTICNRLNGLNTRIAEVCNFPIIGELKCPKVPEQKNHVCYVGAITINRGIYEMVEGISKVNSDVKLSLAGSFSNDGLKQDLSLSKSWTSVEYMGFLDREGVRDLMSKSIAGFVILHPTKAYMDALPIKMFEYMSAGIPVIASNFELWKDIIEENNCGICVDPLNPDEICNAVEWLLNHKEKAKSMGLKGYQAVVKKYNWQKEESKLLNLYREVLTIKQDFFLDIN